ncbi:MAG: COQ9 family protein [Acetobacteraceae bacterium]|nr:COQ9 family protein [Acetobacteraceae bacterium]MCX7685656.1 COQ9 family protein [Acetobacteraceae bacterium]MDW8399166.1 COQ9 family protein [Acetobacteraceae bacterium]
MTPIERSPERDAAIRALLPIAAERGWTVAALAEAVAAAGLDRALAPSLFPRGPLGAIEAWCDLADREMEAAAAADPGFAALRTAQRIRRLVELRLSAAAPHKAALRRALALLALPWNAPVSLRCTARTADAMWHAAGDASADFAWYTKRASLGGIYAATLAYWLRDDRAETDDALAFLDRRIEGLARIGRRCRPVATPSRDRTATG